MSFSEKTILASVEVLPQINAINVRWDKQVLRDGEVIVSEPHRCAYGRYEREKFLADVPDGEAYADAAGLEEHPPIPELDQGTSAE